jgi:ATP adenylyltransferase
MSTTLARRRQSCGALSGCAIPPSDVRIVHISANMHHIWSPWRMEYIENHGKEKDCVFCRALGLPDGPENLIAHRGEHAFVILNRYPYTSGHVMVVPVSHQPDLEKLDPRARAEMMELTSRSTAILRSVYRTVAFNIGVNIGEAAGAGVKEHVHIHVVPRWVGDTNFMATVASMRVLPELLDDTWKRISEAFAAEADP